MAALIDLHTHTSFSSSCSRMMAGELIEAAIEAGLDGVAVTEHLVIEGAEVAQELARHKYGFPVFRGVEAHASIYGHVLVFGSYRDFEPYIRWPVLREIVTRDGGVLIPAHPFRYWDSFALGRYLKERGLRLNDHLAQKEFMQGLGAIEVRNGNCDSEENARAAKLARVLALPGIGGSDAHSTANVGRAATWFPKPITTDADLVTALKRGGYQAAGRRRKGS